MLLDRINALTKEDWDKIFTPRSSTRYREFLVESKVITTCSFCGSSVSELITVKVKAKNTPKTLTSYLKRGKCPRCREFLLRKSHEELASIILASI